MTGPDTIGNHIVPGITKAAEAAGRAAPRVVMALPVAVTDDPDAARAKAGDMFRMYGMLPSYRAMLDREGAGGPGDVAVVGGAKTVKATIASFADRGATDFVAVPFDNQEATMSALSELL
jgi:alkanesulfonate monooxygenase SsuD/methylene tetrahydromethanopterin reductase-like flavin-dependent oxidoreductase (luciferase family)